MVPERSARAPGGCDTGRRRPYIAAMAIESELPNRLFMGVAAAEPDWDAVYTEQLPRVFNFFRYRLANDAVAEDLTSRTFEKAWAARSRYRRDLAGFATWLLSIARNVAVDHFRAQRPHLPLEAAEEVARGPHAARRGRARFGSRAARGADAGPAATRAGAARAEVRSRSHEPRHRRAHGFERIERGHDFASRGADVAPRLVIERGVFYGRPISSRPEEAACYLSSRRDCARSCVHSLRTPPRASRPRPTSSGGSRPRRRSPSSASRSPCRRCRPQRAGVSRSVPRHAVHGCAVRPGAAPEFGVERLRPGGDLRQPWSRSTTPQEPVSYATAADAGAAAGIRVRTPAWRPAGLLEHRFHGVIGARGAHHGETCRASGAARHARARRRRAAPRSRRSNRDRARPADRDADVRERRSQRARDSSGEPRRVVPGRARSLEAGVRGFASARHVARRGLPHVGDDRLALDVDRAGAVEGRRLSPHQRGRQRGPLDRRSRGRRESSAEAC